MTGSFGQALLDGATVTIETTLLPTVTTNLGEEAGAPQGTLTKFLRPRITVRQGNAILLVAAPAGSPSDAPPWGLIAGLVVLGLAGFFLARR